MTGYIFNQAWAGELDRLRSLEDLFDAETTRRLADLGVGEGWRCLEAGAGAGGVATWLADRVGPGGHVVAVDLDPRLLDGHGRANLTTLRHDIEAAEVPGGGFDLVHARATIEHIRDRRRALRHLVAAARPGGWLVVEDIDLSRAMGTALARHVHPDRYAKTYERLLHALDTAYAARGADAGYGAQLPAELRHLGLLDVGFHIHTPLVRGGGERDFVRLGVLHLRDKLVGAGLLDETEIDTLVALTNDPDANYPPTLMVTAWGRAPDSEIPDDVRP